MGRFTQGRRWMVSEKRSGRGLMTQDGVTADEARVAILSMFIQTGHIVERIHEYDPRRDVYRVAVRDSDNVLSDAVVPGDAVAEVVTLVRSMHGDPAKSLRRPSEATAH